MQYLPVLPVTGVRIGGTTYAQSARHKLDNNMEDKLKEFKQASMNIIKSDIKAIHKTPGNSTIHEFERQLQEELVSTSSVLVTTDKTKRIIKMTIDEYNALGTNFLQNSGDYTKLHSSNIEQTEKKPRT